MSDDIGHCIALQSVPFLYIRFYGLSERQEQHDVVRAIRRMDKQLRGKTLLDEYTQLVTPVIQPVDGYFTAPETPGIGVDFTDYVLEHADIETVR